MAATITPAYVLILGEEYDPVLINAIFNALTIGSIIGSEIASGTITGSNIATATITGSNIDANTITGDNIYAGTIGATHIASNTISADHIQSDAITTTKLYTGAVTAAKLSTDSVTTDKIEASAVTAAKIAAGVIDATHIASNSITAAMIQTDAVTAVKIQASAVTSDKIYAGAVTSDKISVNSLDAISANLGTVTSGTVTAATVQTSADPAVSRVKMYSGGLYGYDAVLGNTFRLPTDGTAPYFASGNIISGTITDTVIITNDFKTSSELPWIELTASGLALRVSGSGGLYDTGVYDTATYGAGVTAFLGNSAKPFLSIETATTLADIRLFNRDAVPAGAAEIGDIAFVSGTLRACTTAGTPGTYKTIAFTDSAITSSMFIGTTSVALNRGSGALTLAGITLTTPDIGTPSAGTLTNCTFPTLNQNTTGYASALKSATTTVDVAAATAPTAGQVLEATDSTHATWQTLSSGATTALDNLASVAINTSLLSDTDNTDDLGSAAKSWKDLYLDGTIKGLNGTINPTNLLSNGDFENWTAGINGDGWLASTVLVADFDGTDAATAFTAATGQAATFAGSAQLDTAQKKFGSASLYLVDTAQANTNYISWPDNASWNLGTGKFTIEFWYRTSSSGVGRNILIQQEDASNVWSMGWATYAGGSVFFSNTVGGVNMAVYGTFAPSVDTWYHVALVRTGTASMANWVFYVDGSAVARNYEAGSAGTNIGDYAAALRMEATDGDSTRHYWIDELHIYKGVAKYTANFTPETAALTTDDWNAPDGWTLTGAAASVAREATTIKLGTYSAKLTRAGTDCSLNQAIHTTKGIAYWKSRKITIGDWVYATVADRARLSVQDGVDTTNSSYHTGGSTWEWLSVTHTINASATGVTLYGQNLTGDTSAYFDGAICVEGESAFAFADKPLPRGGTITAETDETKFSHKIPVYIDGTLYYIMLTQS